MAGSILTCSCCGFLQADEADQRLRSTAPRARRIDNKQRLLLQYEKNQLEDDIQTIQNTFVPTHTAQAAQLEELIAAHARVVADTAAYLPVRSSSAYNEY